MIKSELLSPGRLCPSVGFIHLRAGHLTMVFDPETLSLRYLRWGSREVLRSIYGAVRDADWGTVRPEVHNLRVQPGSDGFQIEFDAICRQGTIDFAWKGTVIGEAPGKIRFRFEGEARTHFLTNRIGLCTLHPLRECVGRACEVEDVSGLVRPARFPRWVAPHQPFRNVRALTWSLGGGARAEVRFHGDIFETEDQRNWTDASFKTYSTPLELPFPTLISKGTVVRQEVELALTAPSPRRPSSVSAAPGVAVAWERMRPAPPIGLGVNSEGRGLEPVDRARLQLLALSHLRADVVLSNPRWPDELRAALLTASHLGVRLHLALHLTSRAEREIDELLPFLANDHALVALWMLYRTDGPAGQVTWARGPIARLGKTFPGVPVALGTNANFAEWNRNRPPAELGTLPCYSVNPQVHACDDATLVENLGGQADTVSTARKFSQSPVVISPITLRPRFNPHAVGAREGAPPVASQPLDERQWSLFGAAWTLGSIAALSGTDRLHSVTYFETNGPRGVMDILDHSAESLGFPGAGHVVFPMFHVLADLAGFRHICSLTVPDPLSICGIALRGHRRRRVLLANLRRETQGVKLRCPTPSAHVRMLDESSRLRAMLEPEEFRASGGSLRAAGRGWLSLSLAPLAIACIDLGLE